MENECGLGIEPNTFCAVPENALAGVVYDCAKGTPSSPKAPSAKMSLMIVLVQSSDSELERS